MHVQVVDENIEEDGQVEAVEADADDSTDSAILINGNEGDEDLVTNIEGTPSA